MKAEFGTVGVEIHELTEQATYVARALNMLEKLRDAGIIQDDGSMATALVSDSWLELRRVLEYFYAQGVKPRDIDLGAFV